MTRLLPLLAAVLLPLCAFATDPAAKCLALQQALHLKNTIILNVTYVTAPTNVTTPGSCQASAPLTSAPLCRAQFVIATTSTSAVHAEAWLPDTWFGRFMGTGNGGLDGCIDYTALDYGASLHFATVGTDNRHEDERPLIPEVINDFAFRAVHVEAVIGKQLVQAYYGEPAAKSYYLGAEIVRLAGPETGLLRTYTEPDICNFRPEPLTCTGNNTTNCLTPLLYHRFSPGAEGDPATAFVLAGSFFPFTAERYVILNATEHDFTNFGLPDIALIDKINAGGIATFDGDMSAFRDRGGKFLTWTTRSRTFPWHSSRASHNCMSHCFGGLGPTAFGQGTFPGSNVVNASSHNILLSLVDWVEGSVVPATIIGSGANNTERINTHCRYPMRSIFDGNTFVCV
ncbi:putative feruloyl esterase B-2 [Mycena latifolia]|nr:putative feruloyl esterase B-2 [Mycena latifolia]